MQSLQAVLAHKTSSGMEELPAVEGSEVPVTIAIDVAVMEAVVVAVNVDVWLVLLVVMEVVLQTVTTQEASSDVEE